MLRVGIMTKGLPMRRRGILRGLLAGRCADGNDWWYFCWD
jgi:hypothetical protein